LRRRKGNGKRGNGKKEVEKSARKEEGKRRSLLYIRFQLPSPNSSPQVSSPFPLPFHSPLPLPSPLLLTSGWRGGAGAQEENIFRRTNYHQLIGEESEGLDLAKGWSYPLPLFGGLYTPAVTVFRSSEATGYQYESSLSSTKSSYDILPSSPTFYFYSPSPFPNLNCSTTDFFRSQWNLRSSPPPLSKAPI